MYKDRREAPRLKHAINVTYVMDDGKAIRVCKMKNISKGGATVQTEQYMMPKESIKLTFPESEEIIEAEVVWCQIDPEFIGDVEDAKRYICGLKYKEAVAEKVTEILQEIESRK